uniref:Uncharacterized protein n=1 Tax=Arundo donax TaxID=35708 RepID=A0A0A8ZVN8_ARUDO
MKCKVNCNLTTSILMSFLCLVETS